MKVPTGGKAREPKGMIPVKFRSRQLQSGWEKIDRIDSQVCLRLFCFPLLWNFCNSGVFLLAEQMLILCCSCALKTDSERFFVFPGGVPND